MSLTKSLNFIHMLKDATHWRSAMRCFFLLYLVTFSFTPFFRDFFAVLALICLVSYYAIDYKNSVLRLFDGKQYFYFYYAFLVLGIVFSQNIGESFLIVLLHSFTSLTLPFIAMECVHNMRELKHVIWALVLALIIQGCNGIYQYFMGYDFISHTAVTVGRLTGSFSDYRVGNYIALTIIPASAIYLILRPKFKQKAWLMTAVLLSPAAFLMFFSYTRNAYITLLAAIGFSIVLWRVIPWKVLLVAALGIVGLLQLRSIRLSWYYILSDDRWHLWGFAYELFKEFPLVGAGIGQYMHSAMALEHIPTAEKKVLLTHPHNIYLQFLSENGIIGFCLALTFLLGILFWGYKKLRLLIVQNALQDDVINQENKLYWRIGAFFWCGFGAFLVSGIVGHNFFQRWWQALVMAYLGVMIGIIVQATQKSKNQV